MRQEAQVSAISIFPVSIYVHRANEIDSDVNSEISNSIDRFTEQSIDCPWLGEQLKTTYRRSNAFDSLPATKQMISSHIDKYLDSLGWNHGWKHQSSWFNFNGKNDFIFAHCHSKRLVSGVYYHQTIGRDGNIVFESPSISLYSAPLARETMEMEHRIIPEKGMLILFPSFLRHRVDVNKTEHTRISLSFNVDHD